MVRTWEAEAAILRGNVTSDTSDDQSAAGSRSLLGAISSAGGKRNERNDVGAWSAWSGSARRIRGNATQRLRGDTPDRVLRG